MRGQRPKTPRNLSFSLRPVDSWDAGALTSEDAFRWTTAAFGEEAISMNLQGYWLVVLGTGDRSVGSHADAS